METLKTGHRQYNAIDIMKVIMALLVVMIHKPFFSPEHPFAKYISEEVIAALAVPFFFIVSSFLCFKKMNGTKADNKKFIDFEKRLLILYIVWTIIYIPASLIKFYGIRLEGMTFKLFLSALMEIAKKFFLSSSFVHLWYVNTLMLSVALLFLMRKKLSDKAVLGIAFAAFSVSNLFPYLYPAVPSLEAFAEACPPILSYVFGKGLLCTAAGMFLSDKDLKSDQVKLSLAPIALVVLILFSVFSYEYRNTAIDTVRYFLVVSCSVSIFIMCRDLRLKDSGVYKTLRNYSSLIYFTHMLMISEIFELIAETTGIPAFYYNKPLIYLTTILFAVIVSTVIILLGKTRCFKWMKYLY